MAQSAAAAQQLSKLRLDKRKLRLDGGLPPK